jgi:LuxR family transcriptional regulator, maltose regulon positive regulatory protein
MRVRGFPVSKLSIPGERLRIVPRDVLLTRLAKTGSEIALTLVAAPAGFGKSTLVSAWLRGSAGSQRTAWLSLDEADADGARFMRGIVAALQRILPSIGATSLLGQSGFKPLEPHAVMTLLCEEIERIADAPIVLVLDDYHLAETDEIDSAIEALVDHMPRCVRLVLVSRRLPRFSLERWRMQQRLLELNQFDLRFSTAEASRFLRYAMELDVEEATVAALEARTDGWVAGLQMAALSLRRSGAGAPAVALVARFSGSNRLVAGYLASEVLRAQPEEVRSFLGVTSVLGRFNRSLCDAVTRTGNASEMLRRIEQDHLFLVPLDDERRWFRYHPLFADFLASNLSEERVRGAHARASAWYESKHQIDDAIRHAHLAGDVDLLIRLFRSHFEELMCRGEIRTLLHALDEIPKDVLLQHADLRSLKAWLLYLTGKTVEAREYELASAAEQDSSSVPAPTLGRTKVLQAYFALNWGDPAAAPKLAEDALRLLDADSAYFRVLAMSYLGQAQSVLNQRAAAVQTLRHAFYLGEYLGNAPKALDALLHLVPLLRDQGRVLEGIELCEAAVARYQDVAGSPLPFAAPAHLALGQLLYELDDLAQARARLEQAESLSSQMGMLWFHLMSLCWLAKVQHASGDKPLAWRTIARARELAEAGDGPRRRQMVELVTCELYLKEGDLDSAAHALEVGSSDEIVRSECEVLLQGHLLLARKKVDETLVILKSLEHAASRDGFEGSHVRVLILRALAHRAAGQSQLALRTLARAVVSAAPRRLRRSFTEIGPVLFPMLDGVRHVAPEFVADLCPHFRTGAEGRAPMRLEPLTEREITLLQLLNRGLRNKEIAASLSLTLGTTKQYMNRLFGKLGARNRVEAVTAGRELRVLN